MNATNRVWSNVVMPKLNPKRQKHKRGVAALEAALALPILVLLTFGFIEIGWYVNSLQILHDAARQGAKQTWRDIVHLRG